MSEFLRRSIRRVVGGPASPLYSAAARTLNAVEIARREGIVQARFFHELAHAEGAPREIRLRSLAYPMLVRPGGADIPTLIDNVIREEYAKHLPRGWSPRTMIDAGGHIGDTSAYFATRYPNLQIVALEPQAENLRLARHNLTPYGTRVRLLDKALAGRAGHVAFGGEQTGGSLGQSGTMVETMTVPDVLAMLPAGRADLLKMDIEGAEQDVIETSSQEWLPFVDMIIAELHGPSITASVVKHLAERGFGARRHRSLTFFRRGW